MENEIKTFSVSEGTDLKGDPNEAGSPRDSQEDDPRDLSLRHEYIGIGTGCYKKRRLPVL